MPTVRKSGDERKISIFYAIIFKRLFPTYVKASNGFNQIKDCLCHDKLTFSISQKVEGGGGGTAPGSDAIKYMVRTP